MLLQVHPMHSFNLISVASHSWLLVESVLNFRSTLDAHGIVIRDVVDSVKIHQIVGPSPIDATSAVP